MTGRIKVTSNRQTVFQTRDGLKLAGEFVIASGPQAPAVLLLHGNGTNRDEDGLFSRLAESLGAANISSLRFDLRAHGQSEGQKEDRTLSAHLNDISVALEHVRGACGVDQPSVVATSFSGGLAAWYAATNPDEVNRLVLLNPQLDHKTRFVDEPPWWVDGYLKPGHAEMLCQHGYLEHTTTLRVGRAMLNEVFWIRACRILDQIRAPTLLLHGTLDQRIPVEASRAAAAAIPRAKLVEFEGADHGFAVSGDEMFNEPRTREWQAKAINHIIEWVSD